MKVAALLSLPLVAPVMATLAGCVTSSNRCPSGYEYSSQYDTCFAADAGSDAGAASKDAAPPSTSDAGALSDDGGDGGVSAQSTGLGNSCNADSDCTGTASYCLKSPLAPSSPGYCTITHCTPATCTSAYGCCDCTASSVSQLQAYPPGFCAPTSDESELTSFGCTCQ
jgi:hypothetical protein